MKRSNPWITAALQSMLLLATVACRVAVARSPRGVAPDASPAPPTLRSRPAAGSSHLQRIRRARRRVLRRRTASAPCSTTPWSPRTTATPRSAELRPVTLTAGRAAYVSYRVNNQMYWTRQRVWHQGRRDRAHRRHHRGAGALWQLRVGWRELGPVAAVDPAHGELDDFVVPPLGERGATPLRPKRRPGSSDLLELPVRTAGVRGGASASRPAGDAPSTATARSAACSASGGPDRVFVPRGSRSDPAGAASQRSPRTMVLTTGRHDLWDVSGEARRVGKRRTSPAPQRTAPTGTAGRPAHGRRSDGLPACCTTSGNPFVTTAVATTVSPSPHQHEAPEPGMLWLVACGAIGVAQPALAPPLIPRYSENGPQTAGPTSKERMVGATGFEPATSRSRTERSTRLSHAPTNVQV